MESNTLQNWQYKILHILLNIIQYSCIFAVHIHELIYLFIPHVWCYVQSNWAHLCTVKECAQSHSCLWSFMNNLGRETIFRNQNEGENGFSVVLWGFSWGGGGSDLKIEGLFAVVGIEPEASHLAKVCYAVPESSLWACN